MVRRKDIFDFLYLTVGMSWLFMMLFTTRLYTVAKTAMLGFLVVLAFAEILCKNIKVVKPHFLYVFFFILYSFLSLIIGMLNGFEFNNVSDFPLIQYYIITPICVLILSTVIGRYDYRKEFLWKSLMIMTCVLVVLDVTKVGTALIGMSLPFLSFIDLGSNQMTEELAVRASNETSLLFLLPIVIFLMINKVKRPKELCLYLITVCLGFVYAFISGRRILDIEIALSIGFAFFYYIRNRKKNPPTHHSAKKKSVVLWVVILLVGLIVVSRERIMDYVSELVGIDDIWSFAVSTVTEGLSLGAGGVSKRVGNTDALMDMFYDSPIWGNGLNSYALNSLASDENKWSYEVFFVAWLAQTGIIGMLFLFVLIFYVIKRLNRFSKSGDVRYTALMVGFVCYMLACATNPMIYLAWPWIIVIAYCIPTHYYALKTK